VSERPPYETWTSETLVAECDRLRAVIEKNKASFLSLQALCQTQRQEIEEWKAEREGEDLLAYLEAQSHVGETKNRRKFGRVLVEKLKEKGVGKTEGEN